jgi:hypothetical protein
MPPLRMGPAETVGIVASPQKLAGVRCPGRKNSGNTQRKETALSQRRIRKRATAVTSTRTRNAVGYFVALPPKDVAGFQVQAQNDFVASLAGVLVNTSTGNSRCARALYIRYFSRDEQD